MTADQQDHFAELAEIKAGATSEKAGGEVLSSIEDYEEAIAESAGADSLVLNIRSNNGRRFFVVLKAD